MNRMCNQSGESSKALRWGMACIALVAATVWLTGPSLAQPAETDAEQKAPAATEEAHGDDDAAEEGEEETLTCDDCATQPRPNPFLQTANAGVSIAVFAVILLVLYLVAVGYFKGTITRGGGIVSTFVVAFGSFLVLGVMVAWACFQQYTWKACWCKGLSVDENGRAESLGLVGALKQVNWLYWILAIGVAIVLVLAIKMMVNRPAAPQGGDSQQ